MKNSKEFENHILKVMIRLEDYMNSRYLLNNTSSFCSIDFNLLKQCEKIDEVETETTKNKEESEYDE